MTLLAGCFITLASDVAAMAPATTIGAVHPVTLGSTSESPAIDPAMKQKLRNYAVSYIESIAARRHRNVEWARTAVRHSASITAEKAMELKVVEIIATDRADLLWQLNDRNVAGRALRTADTAVIELPRSPASTAPTRSFRCRLSCSHHSCARRLQAAMRRWLIQLDPPQTITCVDRVSGGKVAAAGSRAQFGSSRAPASIRCVPQRIEGAINLEIRSID